MSIAEIRQLIGSSQIEEALQEMQKIAAASGKKKLGNTLTLLSGQFNSNERNNRIGLLTPADYGRTRNRISFSLLETLDGMDDGSNSAATTTTTNTATGNPTTNGTGDGTVTGTGDGNPPVTPKPGDQVTTVVFLASNPLPTAKLQLEKEYGRINQKLNRSDHFQKFRILYHHRITPSTFTDHLETSDLDIVHFSGHGENATTELTTALTRAGRKEARESEPKEIESSIYLLQEEDDLPMTVPLSFIKSAFADAQEGSNNSIKAVVFNACHSEEIAKAVSEVVEYVVGTSSEVGDKAAIAFAQAFYDTIARSGKTGKDIDIERAVRRGRTAALPYNEPKDRFRLYKDGDLVDM